MSTDCKHAQEKLEDTKEIIRGDKSQKNGQFNNILPNEKRQKYKQWSTQHCSEN